MDRPPIPLGRRIGEIIEAKGRAFSVRALSKRIGLGKDKLYRVINGERYISPSELELVAAGLRMSVQRIKQEDTRRDEEELRRLLTHSENLERALRIAERLVSIAIGVSESFIMINYLGAVHYELRNYDVAHEHWMQAYELAKAIYMRYGETECLYHVLTNLMLSFTVRKEYAQALKIVQQAKPILSGKQDGLAALYYTLGCIALDKGDPVEARHHFYQELESLQSSQDKKAIGKSEQHIAHIEYKLGNLRAADHYYQRAISKLSKYDELRLAVVKDYVKVLIEMGSLQQAEKMTRQSLDDIQAIICTQSRYTQLQAKFLILLSVITDEASSAMQVLHLPVHKRLKQLATKFLMDFYSRHDDEGQLIKYYKMAENFVDAPAIYDEEGF